VSLLVQTVPGNRGKVSLHTVERLSTYRRALDALGHEGVRFIHSHRLAALVGVTPAQLRRDLASFGSFGNIARGYDVEEMSHTISRIIGTDEMQNIALVGIGYLGRALLSYRGFEERGFRVTAAFDTDPEKVGRVFAGCRCYPLDDLERIIAEANIHILVLAAQAEGLQSVVDRAAAAGVRGFMNFVPKMIIAPPDSFIEPVDISAKLEKLSFLSRQSETEHTQNLKATYASVRE
jgi:redox-sensing transcriptional repressor